MLSKLSNLYSVKMRSSLGGKNGNSGKHISGAERIVPESEIQNTISSFYERAKTHERGEPDFINLKIQKIDENEISFCKLLNVYSRPSKTKDEGRKIAKEELIKIGVKEEAVEKAFYALESLNDSIRGAMILSAETGERLDDLGERGVRCSNMDAKNKESYSQKLSSMGLSGDHAREALVLASKVAGVSETVAELCWSDDPDYVTGYVGSSKFGYCRISVMKDKGDSVGGRIFFVKPETNLEEYIEYMQNKVVLIEEN